MFTVLASVRIFFVRSRFLVVIGTNLFVSVGFIVLWEIFSGGEIPFANINFSWQLADAVMQGERPAIPAEWSAPKGIVKLMQRCWQQLPRNRPVFSEIELVLLQHLVERNIQVEATTLHEPVAADYEKLDMKSLAQLNAAMQENNVEYLRIRERQAELKAQIRALEHEFQQNEDHVRKCKAVHQSLKTKIAQTTTNSLRRRGATHFKCAEFTF
jgi:hypothetical protein